MRNPKRALSQTIHTAEIANISHDGRGIAYVNNKTVFLNNALPTETVEFVYTHRQSKYDEGDVVNVLTASPQRVTPQCPHFNICGGCSLQHLHSDEQINVKQKILLEQLQHIGGVKPKKILPPLTASTWGYRRKARLGVRYVIKKNKVLVGFREKNGRYLADIDNCHVLYPQVGLNIIALKQLITELATFEHIPQIEVAVGDQITALIFRHLKPLPAADIELLRQFAITHHFQIYLQPDGIDSITRLWPENNENFLSYALPQHNIELKFNPGDFIQVNAEINQQMVSRALELLAPEKNEKILDLFCGLGNFTLALAHHCTEITGIEGDNAMIERCHNNALHNKINNAHFYRADLSGDWTHQPWAKQQYDKILLDPPRAGAWEIVQNIQRFAAKQILYISCNPATLARDAAELIRHGYQLKAAGVMDMFSHTSHIEAMALFTKR